MCYGVQDEADMNRNVSIAVQETGGIWHFAYICFEANFSPGMIRGNLGSEDCRVCQCLLLLKARFLVVMLICEL